MRYAIPILILIVLIVIQSALGPRISIIGGRPDFVLLMVVCIAIERGSIHGMLWALAGGLLLDLSAAGPVGASALALIPVGFLAGLGERPAYQIQFPRPILITPLATVIYYVLLFAIFQALGQNLDWQESLLHIVAPSTVINMILAPLFYIPIHMLFRRLQPTVQW